MSRLLPVALTATPESDKAWLADPRVADLVARKVAEAVSPVNASGVAPVPVGVF
jgi:hypothetical protein